MDSETTTYVILLIGIIGLLIWVLSEKAKQGNEEQKKTNQKLEQLSIDITSYFIQNGNMKVGIDVEQRKIFQAGIETGTTIFTDGTYHSKIQLIDLNKVIDVQIIEDNIVTSKVSNASMLGRSIVGGALTGGVGAIVGGSTAKSTSTDLVKEVSLRFKMNDLENPYYDIQVFYSDKGVSRSGAFFKESYQNILNLFGRIELVLSELPTKQ